MRLPKQAAKRKGTNADTEDNTATKARKVSEKSIANDENVSNVVSSGESDTASLGKIVKTKKKVPKSVEIIRAEADSSSDYDETADEQTPMTGQKTPPGSKASVKISSDVKKKAPKKRKAQIEKARKGKVAKVTETKEEKSEDHTDEIKSSTMALLDAIEEEQSVTASEAVSETLIEKTCQITSPTLHQSLNQKKVKGLSNEEVLDSSEEAAELCPGSSQKNDKNASDETAPDLDEEVSKMECESREDTEEDVVRTPSSDGGDIFGIKVSSIVSLSKENDEAAQDKQLAQDSAEEGDQFQKTESIESWQMPFQEEFEPPVSQSVDEITTADGERQAEDQIKQAPRKTIQLQNLNVASDSPSLPEVL